MRAEIVSIGTELLLGTITDTNASYLAQRLAGLGIDCYYVSQVGDNLERLVETLTRARSRSDLIVTTGGLGPTQDDLTREAIAALMGETMEADAAMEAELRAFFARRGVDMPAANLKQATLIASAEMLQNPVGTAPGWWVAMGGDAPGGVIVAMPGVPYEMKRMWEREAEPRLRAIAGGTIIVSRTLKVLGMGESAVADKVSDLLEGSNPTLAPYAKQDGVHLRMTAKASDTSAALELIAPLEAAVRERLGEAIYGSDEENPFGVVRRMLEGQGMSFVLLEVGPPVAGALSQLLGGAGSLGALSVANLATISRLLGRSGLGPESLDEAVQMVSEATGADVVLAVSASSSGQDASRGAAVIEVETVLRMPEAETAAHLTKLRQTWKTELTEVRRLAGLTTCNLLRLRMLKRRQGR